MKTALSDARKRVAEAKAQCERQAELLEKLEVEGASPSAIEAAGRLLDVLDRVLSIMSEHLQGEEDLQPTRIIEPPLENL